MRWASRRALAHLQDARRHRFAGTALLVPGGHWLIPEGGSQAGGPLSDPKIIGRILGAELTMSSDLVAMSIGSKPPPFGCLFWRGEGSADFGGREAQGLEYRTQEPESNPCLRLGPLMGFL